MRLCSRTGALQLPSLQKLLVVGVATFSSLAASLTLSGTPQANYVVYNNVRQYNDIIAQNTPDGKFFMLALDRSTLPGNHGPWLINNSPSYLLNANDPAMSSGGVFTYNDPSLANKPVKGVGGQNNGGTGPTVAQTDYTLLAAKSSIPIPSASTTGLRGNGTHYDETSIWIFNAFYLKQTSQVGGGAGANALIGFEHCEDHWQDQPFVSGGCCHKSIGVRYSSDAGLSWTRAVPIITKTQGSSCDPSNTFTGTGDFATAWHPGRKEWIIYAQEGAMVLSRSSDPLGRPGTWTRYDPVSGNTQPGFKGGDTSLIQHGDFIGNTGSSASIIYDSLHQVWHMVYDRWAGGLGYTNSTDLLRWQTPVVILDSNSFGGNAPNPRYPTLFGDGGDVSTSTGTATLWYGGDGTLPNGYGRAFWSIGVTF